MKKNYWNRHFRINGYTFLRNRVCGRAPLEKRNCYLSDYFRGVPVLFELYCCRSEGNKDGMHTRVV